MYHTVLGWLNIQDKHYPRTVEFTTLDQYKKHCLDYIDDTLCLASMKQRRWREDGEDDATTKFVFCADLEGAFKTLPQGWVRDVEDYAYAQRTELNNISM